MHCLRQAHTDQGQGWQFHPRAETAVSILLQISKLRKAGDPVGLPRQGTYVRPSQQDPGARRCLPSLPPAECWGAASPTQRGCPQGLTLLTMCGRRMLARLWMRA